MPSKLKLPGLKLLICRTKGVEVMSIPPCAADTFSKIGGCLSFKGTSQMTFLSFLRHSLVRTRLAGHHDPKTG